MPYLVYFSLFLVAGLILVSLAVYGWRHRSVVTALPFSLTMLLLATWPLAAALDVLTPDLPTKILLMKIRLIPVGFASVSWLLMVALFTGRSNLITRHRLLAVCLPLLITTVALIIDSGGFFRDNYRVDLSGPYPILLWHNGPWVYVHLLYTYVLYMVIIVWLVRSLRRVSTLFSRQMLSVLIATILPLITEIRFQTGNSLLPNTNVTPIAFALAGLLLAWAIFSYRLFNLVPLARNSIIDSLSDGVIVIDGQNIIADLNVTAEKMLGITAKQVIGQPAEKVFHTQSELIQRYRDVLETQEEISLGEGADRRIIELQLSPLKDARGSVLGRTIMLHNITERKRAEEQLRKLSQAIEQSQVTVVITDRTGLIEYANPQFVVTTGYSLQEAVGQNPRILQSGETSPDEYRRLWTTITAGHDWRGIFHNKKKNGELYWEEAIISPIKDAGGQITHFVAVKEDITERIRAEEALKASERNFRELFEATPDSMVIVNEQALIVSVNEHIEQVLGYARAELVNQPLEMLIPEALRSQHGQHLSEFFREPQRRSMGRDLELFARRKDGSLLPVEISLSPLRTDRGWLVIAGLQDITERKQAQEKLLQQNKLLSVLYENMLDVLQFQELDHLLMLIIQRATELLNAPYGEIMLLDGDELVVHAYTPNQSFLKGDRVTAAEAVLSWQAVQTQQPVIIDDYAAWPYRRALYDNEPIHAVSIYPIMIGDRCVGIFDLSRDRVGDTFSPEEIQTGNLFARLAALAIDNDQAYTIIQQQNQLLQALHEVALDIGAQLDMSALLREAMARAVEILKADRGGGIYLYDAELNILKLSEGSGINEGRAGLSIPIGQGVAGQVFQTARPLIVNDYSNFEGHLSVLVSDPPSSVMGVPLIFEQRPIGVLNVFANSHLRTFTPADVELAELFAAQFVIAIRNAQLYQQAERELAERTRAEESARRQAQELALLGEVRTGLARELELADLFRVAVEATAKILGYPQVSLYLQQGDVLQLQHQVGYKHPFLEIPITWGVMARSVRTGEIIFLPDVRIDLEFIGALDDVASEVCVPLFDQHTAVGALNVETIGGTVLTEADVRVLGALGEHISVAISRARLYAKLRESERRYKDLVDNANDIIYKTDPFGRFTFVNPVGQRVMGFPEAELLGRHYLDYIHPDYRQAAKHFYRRQFASKTIQTYYEFPSLLPDGRLIWVGQNVQLILNEIGNIIETQVIARDITELHDSRQRYKDLVDNASDIIYTITPAGHFTFVNPTTMHIMGYTETELIGKRYLTLIRPDFRRRAAHFYAKQFQDRAKQTYYEYPAITKNGEVIWLGQKVQLTLNPTGDQVIEAHAIARDITDLHQAEEALRRQAQILSERNAELDAFAHTVAHDLKGLIGGITGYTELLVDEQDELSAPEIKKSLHNIDQLGHKAVRVINELMVLSGVRQQAVSVGVVEMGRIVEDAVQRLNNSIKEAKADISLPDRASWPIALGYGPWLEEVWLNYLSNAIKYGGKPPHVEVGSTLNGDSSIRFWVHDDGRGLTPEECDRLFTAFTRLDQVQAKGHGLGLSIVKRIIDKLGGTVGVESEIGAGSTFYFTLPAATTPP